MNRCGHKLRTLLHRALVSRRDLILAALWLAQAQDMTFSTDVNLVELLATVRDKTGRFVKGDDFLLREDGCPKIIRYFSRNRTSH